MWHICNVHFPAGFARRNDRRITRVRAILRQPPAKNSLTLAGVVRTVGSLYAPQDRNSRQEARRQLWEPAIARHARAGCNCASRDVSKSGSTKSRSDVPCPAFKRKYDYEDMVGWSNGKTRFWVAA